MVTATTPEESAKLILAIFRYHNIQIDRVLMAAALSSQFIDMDGSLANYEAGVKFAIEHGWIEMEPGIVRLKAPGTAEM